MSTEGRNSRERVTRAGRRTRLVSLAPDIGDPADRFVALRYQLERAFAGAAEQHGVDYVVFCGKDGAAPSGYPLRVVPTFTEANFNRFMFAAMMNSPLLEASPTLWAGSREFCDNVLWSLRSLDAYDDHSIANVIYFYYAHPVHIASVIRLGLALRGTTPIVLNLYHLNEIYGEHRPSRVPGLREFLAATRQLRYVANVHLRVDNVRLAAAVLRDTGEKMEVLPFIAPVDDGSLHATDERRSDTVRISYPTVHCGRSRGFDLVLGLAERLDRPNVEIVMREPDEFSLEFCQITLAARGNRLRTVAAVLEREQYVDLVRNSDLILVPYRQYAFLNRTSSVVADAVMLGKPMVGTADTWIGDQIETLGAGLTFSDGDVDQFVSAVEKVLDNREQFRRVLMTRRDRWIKDNNPRAFVGALLECLPAGSGIHDTTRAVSSRSSQRRMSGVEREFRLLHLSFVLHALTPLRDRVLEPIRSWIVGRWAALCLRPRGRLWLSYDTEAPGGMSSRFDKDPVINWRTRGVEAVEIRVDAHDGMQIHRGGPRGTIWGTHWLRERRFLYLQDVSAARGGRLRTLARLRYRGSHQKSVAASRRQDRQARALPALRLMHRLWGRRYGRLSVTPMGTVINGRGKVKAEVRWTVPPGARIEIRLIDPDDISGPDGQLFAKARGPGLKMTDQWVRHGTRLYLIDTSRDYRWKILSVLDVSIFSTRGPRYPTTALERAWQVLGLLLRGLRAHLMDDDGYLRGPDSTDAGVMEKPHRSRFHHALLTLVKPLYSVATGRRGHLAVTPVVPGHELADARHLKVDWTTPAGLPVEIRIGAPDGQLFAKKTASGSQTAGGWAADGTTFYLMVTSTKRSRATYRTLDILTVSAPTRRTWTRVIGVARGALQMLFDGSIEKIWREAFQPIEHPDTPPAVAPTSRPDEGTERTLDQPGSAGAGENPRAGSGQDRQSRGTTLAHATKPIRPDEWGIVPSSGVGETMLVAEYSRAFLEVYGGTRLVIFQVPHLLDACRLFPHAPITLQAIDEFAWGGGWGFHSGRLLRWEYPLILLKGASNHYTGMTLHHIQVYLNEVRLPMGRSKLSPRVDPGLRDAAARRFRDLGLKQNRTVVLAPSSKSAPQVPISVWSRIADVLRHRGYSLATNARSGEYVVPGTAALHCSLSEFYAATELAGTVVASRSGICDLCAPSHSRLHILRPDRALVVFPGVNLLQSMFPPGQPDSTNYHTMAVDETHRAFSERVLAHPDFA